MPISGEIRMFGGSSAPTDFLLCDGSAVSRTTYADLFAVIGTTYGAGDGSTTFNVPDLRTKVPVGAGTGIALGSAGGANSITLTEAQLPAHNHSIGCDTTEDPAGDGPSGGYMGQNGLDLYYQTEDDVMAPTGSTGSGASVSVMQAYQAVNYIIAE